MLTIYRIRVRNRKVRWRVSYRDIYAIYWLFWFRVVGPSPLEILEEGFERKLLNDFSPAAADADHFPSDLAALRAPRVHTDHDLYFP